MNAKKSDATVVDTNMKDGQANLVDFESLIGSPFQKSHTVILQSAIQGHRFLFEWALSCPLQCNRTGSPCNLHFLGHARSGCIVCAAEQSSILLLENYEEEADIVVRKGSAIGFAYPNTTKSSSLRLATENSISCLNTAQSGLLFPPFQVTIRNLEGSTRDHAGRLRLTYRKGGF